MRLLLPTMLLALTLGGCGLTMAERENADDATCREALAKRNETRPGAYETCRQGIMSFRRDRAIITSGN